MKLSAVISSFVLGTTVLALPIADPANDGLEVRDCPQDNPNCGGGQPQVTQEDKPDTHTMGNAMSMGGSGGVFNSGIADGHDKRDCDKTANPNGCGGGESQETQQSKPDMHTQGNAMSMGGSGGVFNSGIADGHDKRDCDKTTNPNGCGGGESQDTQQSKPDMHTQGNAMSMGGSGGVFNSGIADGHD